ncbi:hypothetical protein [Brachybacterium sp. Z12]|uniref:hypothetical protein n=1 Tax=Brachybacterium sp. Z12 TaxID=2759167 RepID=UPI0037C17414
MCEGRGTTRPFELFGAPWCGPEVAGALRELDLPGVSFREARFRPTHGAFAGRTVHGAQVHLAGGSDGTGGGAPLALAAGFDPCASATRSSPPSRRCTPSSRCGAIPHRAALPSSICCGVRRAAGRHRRRHRVRRDPLRLATATSSRPRGPPGRAGHGSCSSKCCRTCSRWSPPDSCSR